jgi:hypothetical protein
MGSLDRNPNQRPVAVVARPGESTSQLNGRFAGLTDEDIGYSGPPAVYTGLRGRLGRSSTGSNGIQRAAQLSIARQRLADTQDRFDAHEELQREELALKRQEAALHLQVHSHAVADAQAVNDQTAGFLNSLSAIAEDPTSPRGSKEFLTKALAIAGQYPAAINKNPRLSQMVDQYDRDYKNMGGNMHSVQMLSELGQADLKDPNTINYLRTLPGKYPGAVNDKGAMSIFNDTLKAAYQANPQATPPEGTALVRQTITGPGGTMTVEPQATQQNKQGAAEMKLLNQQLLQHQRTLNSAIALRGKFNDDADKDKLTLFDSHIEEAKNNIAETQKLINDRQAGAPPAPAAPVAPADQVTPPADQMQPVHPLEGKRVLQKSTGQYGTFTGGKFMPRRHRFGFHSGLMRHGIRYF